MISIEHIDISGWEAAIRGMRNPMNSWDKSDSEYDWVEDPSPINPNDPGLSFIIGPNDLSLMKKLVHGGGPHAKFRRMINVTMDITAPLYWWKEFDTYKVGTVTNSCSTMHKIHSKEFVLDDFSHEYLITKNELEDDTGGISLNKLVIYDTGKEDYGWSENDPRYDDPYYNDPAIATWSEQILKITVAGLNYYREKFLETDDKRYWWQMIQLLPSSYNQRRTVQLNYETLSQIYKYRRGHKLDEWREFCEMIENLPYSELITINAEGDADDEDK